MKNIIIGTAGHVDHGKTMLIKALTGIDTDRLKEEKKRGITIELGFAYLPLPDGEKAGIIDVPGHEKFVKNMLAGAGGIDIVLLVVAADEGFMPQTREHLGILSLLDIQEGIVVVTKSDMVDPEWIGMIKEEIAKEVAGTFLEHAPVVPVSAYTGEGLDALKRLIYDGVGHAKAKNTAKPFRIPIDRVFSVGGFGTVITGTMIEGSLAEGDEVMLYPSLTATRVRNLQVHSQNVGQAFAGQRVAVNLAGLKKDDVERGDALAAPGSMQNTLMLDVKLHILKDSEREILNGARLHFYHGARDLLCKLVLLESDSLGPGGDGYAQLRFSEEIAAKKGDHFVVRFYSPVETVGGGVILDPNPPKRRRGDEQVLEALRIKENGSLSDRLLQAVAEGSPTLTPIAEIQKQLLLDDETMGAELRALLEQKSVFSLTNKIVVDAGYQNSLRASLQKILGEYHAANPLQSGMRRDELRGKFLPGREIALADRILSVFASEGVIRLDNQKAALADFQIHYSESDQRLADQLERLYREGGFSPPSYDEVFSKFPKEKNALKQVFDAMTADGVLVMAAPQLFFHREFCGKALEKLSAYTAEHGQIALGEFRDLLGTSRRFAVALLEYFDRRGITKKVGDNRVLTKK